MEDIEPTMYSTVTCINGLHEQASPDTIVKPEIKTPESERLPILSVPTQNPQRGNERIEIDRKKGDTVLPLQIMEASALFKSSST